MHSHRKLLWAVLAILSAVMTVFFTVKDIWEIGQLGLPDRAWIGIGLVVFFGSIFALVAKMHDAQDELAKRFGADHLVHEEDGRGSTSRAAEPLTRLKQLSVATEQDYKAQIELLQETVRSLEEQRRQGVRDLEANNQAYQKTIEGLKADWNIDKKALEACAAERSQQKAQLKALTDEWDRRRAVGASDAAEIERLTRILDKGEFFIKLTGSHRFNDGRSLEPGAIVWRSEDVQELKTVANFADSTSFPLAIPSSLEKARQATGVLQQEINACRIELAGAQGNLEQCRRKIHWLEFKYEQTPAVFSALGRTPVIRLQYYTGQENRELAYRITNLLRESGWEVAKPIETGSTDLANTEEGSRIMLTYEKSKMQIFHNPTQSLEYAALRGYGLFGSEKIVRTISDKEIGADLLVTIFPKNFWD
jgi:hypothetical protein